MISKVRVFFQLSEESEDDLDMADLLECRLDDGDGDEGGLPDIELDGHENTQMESEGNAEITDLYDDGQTPRELSLIHI